MPDHWQKVKDHFLQSDESKKDAESGVTLDSVTLPQVSTSLRPLYLPHGRAVSHLVRVLELYGNYTRSFAKLILSPSTSNLLSASFWYILTVQFKQLPDNARSNEYCETLFDQISCWYAVVFQSIPSVESKDILLRDYSECLSQAVFFAFQNSFPYDLESFGDAFHLSLQTNIAFWLTGVVLSKPSTQNWFNKKLMSSTATTSGSQKGKVKVKLTRRQVIQRNWAAAMGCGQEGASAADPAIAEAAASSKEDPSVCKAVDEIARDLFFIEGEGKSHHLHYGRPAQSSAPLHPTAGVSATAAQQASLGETTHPPPPHPPPPNEAPKDDTTHDTPLRPPKVEVPTEDSWQLWMGRQARGEFSLEASSPLLRHFMSHVIRQGTMYIAGCGEVEGQVAHGKRQAEGQDPPPGPLDSVYHKARDMHFISSRVLGSAEWRSARRNLLRKGKLLHSTPRDTVSACEPKMGFGTNGASRLPGGGLFAALKSACPTETTAPLPQANSPDETPLQQARGWLNRFNEVVESSGVTGADERSLQRMADSFAETVGGGGGGGGCAGGVPHTNNKRPASAPTHRKTRGGTTRPASAGALRGGVTHEGSAGFSGTHPVASTEDCDPVRSWVPISQQYVHMANDAKVQLHATYRGAAEEVRRGVVSPLPVRRVAAERRVSWAGCRTRSLLNHKAQANRIPRAEACISWQNSKTSFASKRGVEAGAAATRRSSQTVKDARATWDHADLATNNNQEEMQKSLILLTAENERVLAKLKGDQETCTGDAMRLITSGVERVNVAAKSNNLLDSIVAVSDLLSLINANLVAVSGGVRDILVRYSTKAATRLRTQCKEARTQYASSQAMLDFLHRVESGLKASGGGHHASTQHPKDATHTASNAMTVGATAAEDEVRRARTQGRQPDAVVSPRVGHEVPSLQQEARAAEESYLAQTAHAPPDNSGSALTRLRTEGLRIGAIGAGIARPQQDGAPKIVNLVSLLKGDAQDAAAEAEAEPCQGGLSLASLPGELEARGAVLQESWSGSPAAASVSGAKHPSKASTEVRQPGVRQPWNSMSTVTDRFLRSPLLKQWRRTAADGGAACDAAAAEDAQGKRALFDRLVGTLDRRSKALSKGSSVRRTKIDFEGFSAIDGYVVWSDTAVPVGSSSEELVQRVQQNRKQQKARNHAF